MRVSSRVSAAPFLRSACLWLAMAALLLSVGRPVFAQGPPPREGTSSVGGNTDSFYQAAGALLSATAEGLQHVFRFTKDLVTPGGSGPDAFNGLRKGSIVVVNYPDLSASNTPGGGAPKSIEGTIERIDRNRKELTVRFDSRTTEVFQLVERAAVEVSPDPGAVLVDASRVTIDHKDGAGTRVVHQFRKKS